MSTPSLDTVPRELLALIFGHARWRCTREELARIALTSSYLNAVATPALYAAVIADDERFLFAVRSALARDPSKGQHVRNLVLPRHQSIAAQVTGSDEWRALHDAQLDVLLACQRLLSLEISPLSEAMVAAVPWGSVRRLSLAAKRAPIYKAVFSSCENVTHLNLFDLRSLVRPSAVFGALFGQRSEERHEHHFDALELLSAEWTDPQQHSDELSTRRAVELVRFFCALPGTRRVLLLLSAQAGFNIRFASISATRASSLMRPLKSPKVHIAPHPRVYDVWALALDQKEDYAELGEQVWSDV